MTVMMYGRKNKIWIEILDGIDSYRTVSGSVAVVIV